MIILVDSGIVLRLLEQGDPQHAAIRGAVRVLRGRGDTLVTAPQNAAEFWSVCTRPATARGGYGLSIGEADRRPPHHRATLSRPTGQPGRLPGLARPACRPRRQGRPGARRPACRAHAGQRDRSRLDAQRRRLRPLHGDRPDCPGEPSDPAASDAVSNRSPRSTRGLKTHRRTRVGWHTVC